MKELRAFVNTGEAEDRGDPLAIDMIAGNLGRDSVAAMMRCIDRLGIIGSRVCLHPVSSEVKEK